MKQSSNVIATISRKCCCWLKFGVAPWSRKVVRSGWNAQVGEILKGVGSNDTFSMEG